MRIKHDIRNLSDFRSMREVKLATRRLMLSNQGDGKPQDCEKRIEIARKRRKAKAL